MIGIFSSQQENYAISSSSGEVSRVGAAYNNIRTDAPNLSVSLKVSGNHYVWVGLVPTNPGSGSSYGSVRMFNDSSVASLYLMRDATDIAYFSFNKSTSAGGARNTWSPGGSLFCLDKPSSGTYTYKMQFFYVYNASASAGWYFYNVKLMAKELNF